MMAEDSKQHEDVCLAENFCCVTGNVGKDAPNILRMCYPGPVDTAKLHELRFYYIRENGDQHRIYCNFVISGRYPDSQSVVLCVDLLGAIEAVQKNREAADQLLKQFGIVVEAECAVSAEASTTSWLPAWVPRFGFR